MHFKLEQVVLSATLLGLMCPLASEAQVLYREDFQIYEVNGEVRCSTAASPGGPGTYPFPPGFLLRNVDNRTPANSVAYVNNAWIVREDFSFNVTQCAAFSTSWTSPAGTANDWMWTPPIEIPAGSTPELRWRAVTYDANYRDGYEVRVMTAPNEPTGGPGAIGNQITNSTVLFSTAAENAAWTQRSVPLTGLGGQTVRIAFRNNSNDKFLLLIDDIEVINAFADLAAVAPAGFSLPYTRIPPGLVYPATLGVTARNSGTLPLTQISATAQLLWEGVPHGAPIASDTLASLSALQSAPLVFVGSAGFDGAGEWEIEYQLSAAESAQEPDTTNNTVRVPGPTIGGLELARYDDQSSASSLGIGAGNGGEMGTRIDVPQDYTFKGVRFLVNPPTEDTNWLDLTLTVHLRSFDLATGKPGPIVATASNIPTSDQTVEVDAMFDDSPVALTAGSYFVSVVEPEGLVSDEDETAAMQLGMRQNIFQAGQVFVNWPTIPSGDWTLVETFGANFLRMPQIGLLSADELFDDGFETPIRAHSPHRIRTVEPARAQAEGHSQGLADAHLTQDPTTKQRWR